MSSLNFTGGNTSGFNLSNLNLSGLDLSSLNLSSLNLSQIGNLFKNNTNNTTDTNTTNTTETNTTDTTNTTEDTQEVKLDNAGKYVPKHTNSYQKVYHEKNTSPVMKTHIVKRASDNEIICQANSVTLADINKLFNMDFTNGNLLVYIDGELVFNGTVTDDTAITIFDIIEKFLGTHDIKVEFINSNNETNNYSESVIIE